MCIKLNRFLRINCNGRTCQKEHCFESVFEMLMNILKEKKINSICETRNFIGLFICLFVALCNDDANGNVPLGKSCNRYWQCQGGYPRLQRCPAMLVFDRRSLRCVVPPTEDCEVPTTQPPLPDELEQEGEQNIPNQPPRSNRPQQQGNEPINLPPGAVPIPLRNRPRN